MIVGFIYHNYHTTDGVACGADASNFKGTHAICLTLAFFINFSEKNIQDRIYIKYILRIFQNRINLSFAVVDHLNTPERKRNVFIYITVR